MAPPTPITKHRKGLRWAAVTAATAVGTTFALAGSAFADDVSNNLDASIDTVAEVMPLTLGGANGTTQLYVTPRNGDGKNGCNLTGGTTLVVSVASSDTSVATVSPSSITFGSCGDTPTLTVTPTGEGSATISIGQTSNSTGATFNLAPARFTVSVAPPPNTAPQLSVTGVTGGASYEKGSVPAAVCSVTDAEDGNSSFPATLSAISGPLAVYGLGSQTASCSYTDGGGLTAVASETYGIADTTAPVITFVSRTAANGNGWNNGDVTVNWSCGDSGSGVVSASVSQTVSAEGANQSATGTCGDHAGNTASDTQGGINVDRTAPTAGASAAPAANGNGWNTTDVTVSFSGSDALSGIASCSSSVVLGGEGAGQSASGTCTDRAGNTSASATASGINIDKTAPTLSPTVSPNPVLLNGTASASANAADALSGVDSSSCGTVGTSSVGLKSVSCSATDRAGNAANGSATYSVTYDFVGFSSPVNNPKWINRLKAGQAVPFKWRLLDANGAPVTSLSGATMGVGGLSCAEPGAEGFDPIEEYAAGSSGLQNLGDGYYQLNWKSLASYAGSCRTVALNLGEGSNRIAWFNFTK